MNLNRGFFAAVIVVLVLTTNAFAQRAHNALGIYSDQTGDPYSNCYDAVIGNQFNAYLVLTNPVNNEFDGGQNTARPIEQISGFECRITMPSSASFLTLSEEIAAGDFTDCENCRPNYAIDFATALPVINNAIVLVTWTFLALAPGPHDFFLDETQWSAQTGSLSIIDAEDPQDGQSTVATSSNDELVPVFTALPDHPCRIIVPVATQSWGQIKSIYR